jgi:CDP-diacylglycerol pyrophosphatase
VERREELRTLTRRARRRSDSTLRIPRLATSGIVAALSIAATFAFAAHGAVADPRRGALWTVVQACLLNHRLTGASFPCLEVNVSNGNDRGYVVLQLPFGASDPMLAPTRRIVGVEDPSLQAPDGPNYFEDAWNARKFLQDAPHEPLPHDGVVLAVNSRQSRSQDQLHIHIGCLSSGARRTVQAFVPALPADRWAPLGRPFRGLEFWGRLLVQDNLAGVNPFRLAAEAWPSPSVDRSQLTIAAIGVELSDGGEGFVLLASLQTGRHSVEDFLVGPGSFCR